jgi:hypothetical protein
MLFRGKLVAANRDTYRIAAMLRREEVTFQSRLGGPDTALRQSI